jgi:nucleoside-diphosphate-sugar epimerase
MATKKILITGGAGFIGYHLAKRLLKENNVKLVLADNFQRGVHDKDLKVLLKDSRVTLKKLDLTDESSYTRLGRNYDYVYHLAGVNGTKFFYTMPEEVLRINTLALVYILEWFRKNSKKGKFLYTSSCEAYSGALTAFDKLKLPTPDNVPLVVADPYNPRSSYEVTKLLGEPFVIHYAKAYGFRAVIVSDIRRSRHKVVFVCG